jgi:hypothetical protein
MKVNVGNADRILRITAGVIIVTLTALGKISPWGWLAIGLMLVEFLEIVLFILYLELILVKDHRARRLNRALN